MLKSPASSWWGFFMNNNKPILTQNFTLVLPQRNIFQAKMNAYIHL
jgi:hypothetical protein